MFYEVSEAEDIILPELVHWMHVKLEWEITRTTESTNTIWFKYNWHTLVCKPISKPLTYYKDNIISNNESDFFSKVLLTWVVDRFSQDWDFKEKKPTIYFEDIDEIIGNNWLSIF
mgnify:CR=1 FL=1